MTREIFKDEMLSAEQLDMVAGGTFAEQLVDAGFFQHLGYNMAREEFKDVFADNGVKFEEGYDKSNSYKILTGDGEWTQHPHWAVLGYILSKRKYPGFNGSWTDSKYVGAFMKEHFGISDFG